MSGTTSRAPSGAPSHEDRLTGPATVELTTATTSLSLRLVSDEGVVLAGNAVIVVTHDRSGRVWRSGRFHPPTRRYRFAGLPLGPYRIRAMAAGCTPQTVDVELGKEPHEVELVLPRNRSPLLVFDVTDRMAQYRALARHVHTSATTRALLAADPVALGSPLGGHVELGLASRVLAALVADDRVVAALAGAWPEPLASLVEQWIRERLAATFILPPDSPPAVGRTVAAQGQLFMVVQAVFANAHVRRLVPTPPQHAVRKHVLRVLGGVDHPGLELIGAFLTRLHHPELAAVDLVARSLTPTFPVAAPACLPRRDAGPEPSLPATAVTDDAPPSGEDSPSPDVATASFTLGLLAHLVAAGAALLPPPDGPHP